MVTLTYSNFSKQVNDSTGDNNGPAAGLRNNVAKRTGGAPTNRESRGDKSSPVVCVRLIVGQKMSVLK